MLNTMIQCFQASGCTFSNENIFKLQAPNNQQNDRNYGIN